MYIIFHILFNYGLSQDIFYLFIYILFLAVLGLRCGEQGSLFVVVHGLLIAVASLLWSTGYRCVGFSSCGTWAQ